MFRTLLITLLLGLGLPLVWAGPASADCSCQAPTDTSAIDAAPGAVTATVIGRDGNLWVVDVHDDAKDTVPDRVAIEAYENNGDNCGVIWMPGRGIATLVHPNGEGHLEANGCDEMSVDDVSGWELPVGQSGRQPDLMLGGSWGLYRAVAFDGDERVAFGYEPGSVLALGACPGGERVAELVSSAPAPDIGATNAGRAAGGEAAIAIAVRDLATFSVTSEAPVPAGVLPAEIADEDHTVRLSCLDDDAGSVVVTVDESTYGFTDAADGWVRAEPAADAVPAPADAHVAAAEATWPWLVGHARTAVDLDGAPALGEPAKPPTPQALAVDEPPPVGQLSPWLFVLAGAVGVLYLLKNLPNRDWRAGWTRPREDRDADGYQRNNWFDRFRP